MADADASVVTLVTALYAALVSTATAVWTIYRDWNDKGRLKVTVGFRSLVGNGQIEEHTLVWRITNTGRRSVMLTHAAGIVDAETAGFLVNDPQLPRRLEPGDYHMSICREFAFEGEPMRLYAIDSLGRQFDAPNADVREVKKTLKDLARKGIKGSHLRTAR